MGAECLFCRIIAGSIPAKRIDEDAQCLAFADINPQAPTHVLVVPKEHIASTAHAEEVHGPLLGHLIAKAAQIARDAGLKDGYRLVINTGEDGGQTVDHLHIHVLGGRQMHWPPG
ncbi:MAG TPA: histidine triad nucleotide-binding protein [Acidobacteriaceae bacterium]